MPEEDRRPAVTGTPRNRGPAPSAGRRTGPFDARTERETVDRELPRPPDEGARRAAQTTRGVRLEGPGRRRTRERRRRAGARRRRPGRLGERAGADLRDGCGARSATRPMSAGSILGEYPFVCTRVSADTPIVMIEELPRRHGTALTDPVCLRRSPSIRSPSRRPAGPRQPPRTARPGRTVVRVMTLHNITELV